MESKHVKSVLIGVFSSKVKADRASRSLRDYGISADRITLYSRTRNAPIDIGSAPEFQSFSDEQLRRFDQDLEQGRSLMSVVAHQDPDELIAILDELGALDAESGVHVPPSGFRQTLPLYEEQLRINKQTREIGEVIIRKVVEEVPSQVEVDALHEELDVEHVSVDEVVQQRREPWREGDVLVVPVYEEQLVVVRQLVMREQLRISLHQVTEKHVLSDSLKREHAIIDDPAQTGRVRVTRRGPEPVEEDASEPAGEPYP